MKCLTYAGIVSIMVAKVEKELASFNGAPREAIQKLSSRAKAERARDLTLPWAAAARS